MNKVMVKTLFKCIVPVLLLLVIIQTQAMAQLTVTLSKAVPKYKEGEIVKGTVDVSGVPNNSPVKIDWVNSYGQPMKRLIVIKRSAKTVSFQISVDNPSTVGNFIVATASRQEAGYGYFSILKDVDIWNDYYAILQTTTNEYPRRFFRVLLNTAINGLTSMDAESAALFIQNGFRYYCSNILGENQLSLTEEEYNRISNDYFSTGDKTRLVLQDCPNNPQVAARWKNILQTEIADRSLHRPIGYSFADDFGLTYDDMPLDVCFCPYCMEKYRNFLRNRYNSVRILNQQWGTRFGNWNAVYPMTVYEILAREFSPTKTGGLNFAPWATHREFMDISVADAVNELSDYAVNLDRYSPPGVLGVEGANTYGGNDLWRLSKACYWFGVDGDLGKDIVRSFVPTFQDRIYSTVSSISGTEEESNYTLWRNLLYRDKASIVVDDEKFYQENNITEYGAIVSATLENMRAGISKLLNVCNVRQANVAILYSQASIRTGWILDASMDKDVRERTTEYEKEHSTVKNDIRAWLAILNDLGIPYDFVSYEQLERGFLATKPYRVLILPKTYAISESQAGAITRFANNGGLVIADSCAGIFNTDVIEQRSGVLDSFFGIRREQFSALSALEVNGQYTPLTEHNLQVKRAHRDYQELINTLDPSIIKIVEQGITSAGAFSLASDGTAAAFAFKNVGRGYSAYLNTSLLGYTGDGRKGDYGAKLRLFMLNLFSLVGVTPEVLVTVDDTIVPCKKAIFTDTNAYYVGVIPDKSFAITESSDEQGDAEIQAEVWFWVERYIYDMNEKQLLGLTNRIRTTLKPNEGKFFALLPYNISRLTTQATIDKNVVRTRARIIPESENADIGIHVVRIELYNPRDEVEPTYSRNVYAVNGQVSSDIRLSLSAAFGQWVVVFTDVATGVESTSTFEW